MASTTMPTKRIRLEQSMMPVSSEEELSIVTLKEQNKKLGNNYSHRIRIEQDLRNRIEQLEEVVRRCEESVDPESQISIVNQDLKNRVEDLEYELNKSRLTERRLADDLDRLNATGNMVRDTNRDCGTDSNLPRDDITVPASAVDESSLVLTQAKTIQDLDTKLSDQTELAKTRLKELEELNEKYREALIKIDTLQSEARCIPRENIFDSSEYKTLQSHFSVLYNEATQLKTQLVDSRTLMIDMKNAHLRQLERMEAEESRIQRELKTKIIDLENCYSQARDEAEELKRETDRLEKANDSTLKLDTELKKSLNNYKIQIAQKNNDLQRYKRKMDEMLKKYENHQNKEEPKESLHTHLQKELDRMMSEEKALMQDLDVTGQALDDMQDQNHRLLQQIEEKDEANFKLMSEHLKNNALQKHLNDEKIKLEEYGNALSSKISVLEAVVARLEADKKLHQEVNRKLEIEISTLKKLEELNKKEKLELCQQLASLNLERDKLAEQISLIQRSVDDKTALLTNESFKNKRLIEELDGIRKKYERASKLQSASVPDDVLVEEIKTYKKQLTCPSCKTKPKDAVLTKCFHVFCFDCLKTRVETRQRKCPKCNAQFGANDFHRLYLA